MTYLVLIKVFVTSYKNVHAILRIPNSLTEYYVVVVHNLQDFLEKNLEVITDFPSSYEVVPYLYKEFCSTHNCPIEYDADEKFCLVAKDDLSQCSIVKKIVFQSKPFNPKDVITIKHPLVQQEIQKRRDEELFKQKIKQLNKVLEKYLVDNSEFRYYILKRAKERILIHKFLHDAQEYKISLYYYKNAVFLGVMHDPHFYDDVGYFKFYIIKKDESVEKEYQEWKSEQEFYENLQKFFEENDKILWQIELQIRRKKLEQKVNDIISKFKVLSNNIEVKYYIYESLGTASIYTSLKGYVNKQVFNQYLQLNKQLKGEFNPKTNQWFIHIEF
jgi:hypothetical protein